MIENGKLDPATLATAPGFDPYPSAPNFLPASTTSLSNRLTPAAAADYLAMRAEFAREFGEPMTYAEAYRSFTMQQQRKNEQAHGGPLAAVPGTSNHGWAKAMDFRNGIGYGNDRWEWMTKKAGLFGWTPIASEKWHWEHLDDFTHTTITPAGDGPATPLPTPSQGDDDMDVRPITNATGGTASLLGPGVDWVFGTRIVAGDNDINSVSAQQRLYNRWVASTAASPAKFNDLERAAISRMLGNK